MMDANSDPVPFDASEVYSDEWNEPDEPEGYVELADDEDDEPEDYADMPTMLTCDVEGCMVMFESTSTWDHCADEGKCWPHCFDYQAHALDHDHSPQEIKETFIPPLPDVADPLVSAGVYWGKPSKYEVKPSSLFSKITEATPLVPKDVITPSGEILDAFFAENPPGSESVEQALSHVKNVLTEGNADPQLVHHAVKDLLDKAVDGYVPTQAERVALFVAGLESMARSEHATVVQFSEGRTLAKHRADFTNNECGVCEMLDKYFDQALALLKPLAEEQVLAVQKEQQEQQYIAAGVCVECGTPPQNERRYSLESPAKGFMCSKCAGPYLLMDDGKPGDPWPEEGE